MTWVTTGASVTLPGMDVTPVNVARGHIGATVQVGSLPSALAYTPGGKGLPVATQGDDELHEIDSRPVSASSPTRERWRPAQPEAGAWPSWRTSTRAT